MPASPALPCQPLPHRLWRRLPPTLRRGALARTTAWLAPKPQAPQPQAARPQAARPQTHLHGDALIVVGEFSRPSGIGETARLMAAAARRAGIQTATIDLHPLARKRPIVTAALPAGAPLVLHINPPLLPLALLRMPRAVTRNRPFIGYWAWELPEIPPEWHPALACVTQIWTPSHFTAAALAPLLPGRVRVVPPALVPLSRQPASARDQFGLPHDAIVVLVSFSIASSFTRKNPFAAIAAFRAAFGDDPSRILVLKITEPDHAPADLARLTALAQAPNIRLETRTLTAEANQALTASADIILSLHRAEGFGLVLAEAMRLGKPVVATGWSGNTDFMDDGNAVLVRYRLVSTRDDRAVYRGTWAEPDIADAAAKLRILADDPDLRHAIGNRARSSIQERLTDTPLLAALEHLA